MTSDPSEGTFVHSPGASEVEGARWRIAGWFRLLFLADDGEHLIIGYDGSTLVPLKDPEATTVIEFRHRETRLKTYTLAELGYHRRDLVRTASHYHWGRYLGFDDAGHFQLSMVDGTVLVFDPATGDIVRRFQRDG